MCEFCSEHKRKKWFIDPDNYKEKMLEDKKRLNILQKLSRGPEHFLSRMNYLKDHELEHALKTEHACQIITLDDALEMIDLSDNHVLAPCICRALTANIEKNCCILFGPMRNLANPWQKMEEIDAEELKLRIKDWHNEGLYLETGYAVAPYPAYMCCCDRRYCFSTKMRFSLGAESALMKGHEVAIVDPMKCKGCSSVCMPKCPFRAMFPDNTNHKVVIDPTKCFGCGLCYHACPNNAIELVDRNQVPGARGKW